MRKSGFSAEQIVAIRQRAMTPATKSVASSSAIPAPVADSPMTKLVDQVVGAVRFYVGAVRFYVGAVRFYVGARIDTDLARVQNELRGLAESMGTDDAVHRCCNCRDSFGCDPTR
jgi:energy-converting hydrogenase Eha subunit A